MNPSPMFSLVTALVALPLLSTAVAQQSPRKLARVPAPAAPQAEEPPKQAFDVQDWRGKLALQDLEQRERHYAELLQLARGSREVRQALEQWSRATDAPELAWTARLALRELERAVGPFGRLGAPHPAGPDDRLEDLRSRFGDLERHLGGMDSLFEDLRLRLEDLGAGAQGGWPGLSAPGAHGLQLVPPPQGGARQLHSFQLQMGPDGVTLETTEDVDGQQTRKTYKAKDMEELLQQNPELREQIGVDGRVAPRAFSPRGFSFGGDAWADDGWWRPARPSSAPPTDVLGIYSQKLTAEQARDLGLEPEQGLRIERIEPGTIAQILGLRRGDTLVELDGKPVYSAEDVRKALKERKPEADLGVTIVPQGAGQERRTLRWTPSEPQSGATAPRRL